MDNKRIDFTEIGSENGVCIYVDLTGIGYTTFEPLFLAVGELQCSAAVTHIISSSQIMYINQDSTVSFTHINVAENIIFPVLSDFQCSD
jgi:hypothetical protein